MSLSSNHSRDCNGRLEPKKEIHDDDDDDDEVKDGDGTNQRRHPKDNAALRFCLSTSRFANETPRSYQWLANTLLCLEELILPVPGMNISSVELADGHLQSIQRDLDGSRKKHTSLWCQCWASDSNYHYLISVLWGTPYYGVGFALDFTRCGAIFKRPHAKRDRPLPPTYGVANVRRTEYISNGCHAATFHEFIVGAKEPRPKKKVAVGRITTGEEVIPSFPFSSAILIGDQSSDGQC